jgi:uncharacterized membrane protein
MNKTGEFFLSFLFVLIYYLILDGTMIALYMGKKFGKVIKQIQNGELMKTRLIPGIICFLVLAFGITYFVLGKVRDDHIPEDSARYGLIFGLVVYAVYDLTNYSTFAKYDLQTTLTDILWGGILGFVVTLTAKYTMVAIKKHQARKI